MSEPLVFPTIHMNGTSPESLLEDISKASCALSAANMALARCYPNGRDYYVTGDPTVFRRAQAQHVARMAAVRGIIKELNSIGENIADQAEARKRRDPPGWEGGFAWNH